MIIKSLLSIANNNILIFKIINSRSAMRRKLYKLVDNLNISIKTDLIDANKFYIKNKIKTLLLFDCNNKFNSLFSLFDEYNVQNKDLTSFFKVNKFDLFSNFIKLINIVLLDNYIKIDI